MITELVVFDLPKGITREELLEKFRQSVPTWSGEIKKLQVAVELGLKQATAQCKNILKAAFSGQIVLQDPGDEPVRVLLERIHAVRAGRQANGTGGRARQKVMA